MAFGKKYFSSYKSNNNLDYYLEIFLEDYTGSALELVMGAGGPVIEYETDQEDRFSPIISSSCKIPYLVENYLDSLFIDDLRNNYQERQVYVHIYRSTQSGSSAVAPLWSGFLVMDIGSGVDKYFPYEEHLKFVDGLSLLKDIDFVDLGVTGGSPPFEERVQGNYAQENMYFGPATYIYWIREILAKSGAALTNQGASQNYGFTTSVNWYNGEMNATGQSSDPLHKTKCAVSMFHRKDDQGVFYPDNCYNVLKELLRHWGARITYWKHEFWIVQIPEYITSETGTISTPVNNNSRLYSNTGAYQGSQNHLGDTYYTRYEQTIENDKISKLTGTKYDYLPIIKQVNADFLSFSSKSVFGGFPFGSTAPTQEVFQGTINSPSAADFLYLSIPLDWTWDFSNAPSFQNGGHSDGWWCSIKFNFYAAQEDENTGVITTYYLQYDSGTGNYFWVDSATWTPLGNRSPKYIISSKLAVVTAHIGFEQQIPFEDENGNAISMSGAWSFFLDIEDYGTSSSNPGSFYLNFSGYGTPQRMRNPSVAKNLPTGTVPPNLSGTVSWSNTLQDAQGQVTISSINNPAGFNAGTVANDIRFATTSPFLGLLQTLNNTQSASFGETFNVINSNTQAKQNSEQYNFGTLLWGDSLEFAPSSLQVFNGSTYVNTEPSGEWGRGVLTGTKTFTEILIDEFFSGQTKIIISPSMRLAVGVANKNEDQGGTIRPRYVNPIGKLRETRDGTDPEYFFRRGSFYTLLDEWDYEGYEIIRNVPSTTTQSNGMGSMGGSQSGSPASSGMSPSPMVQALSQNSPLAYIRTTIPATGSNVAVNGNFNTAVGWTLGTGWSIDTTAKKAKFAATGSTSELTQSVLTQGLTYQVNFKVEVTAGTLLVKAGTTGTSQSITSSGDYSIYLDCEGSSLIKFQAGTTFTGNITYITLKDQKSLSSVPIEAIGTAVFKTGDTFNLINSNDDTILPLTVTSNQGSTDTTISVSSTPLYEDIDNGSYLLINQDDLSAQYQNKTKGTVGGFDITATSIDSGSVAISSYIDDDTFATASATSLATSESIKAYVDGQAGHSETLQGVTDNGNTTTNNVMIGSSSAPDKTLVVSGIDAEVAINDSNDTPQIRFRNSGITSAIISIDSTKNMLFKTNGVSEKMRLTSDGKLGIGTTSPSGLLHISSETSGDAVVIIESDTDNNNENDNPQLQFKQDGGNTIAKLGLNGDANTRFTNSLANAAYFGNDEAASVQLYTNLSARVTIEPNGDVGIGITNPTEKLHVVGDILATGDSHADAFKPAVSGNPIKFKNFDSSTEFARITDAGNLLIGDTTDVDEGKLQVFGDINIRNANGSNPTDAGSLYFGETGGVWGTSLYGFRINQEGSANNLQIQSANLTTVKTIISMQRDTGVVTLGYGLTGTTATFDGGSDGEVLKIKSNSAPFIRFIGGGVNRGFLQFTGSTAYLSNQANGDFNFRTNNTDKLIIKAGGNVLIGSTTDSGARLNVVGASTTNVDIATFGNSNSVSKIKLSLDGVGSSKLTMLDATNNEDIILSTQGNSVFTNQVTIPATPVASTDAASKSYVDAHGGGLGPFLPLAGGTLTGLLTGTSATFTQITLGDNQPIFLGAGSVMKIFNDGANSIIRSQGEPLNIDANGINFRGYSPYNNLMKINSNGNVLIGTTTDDGSKLRVEGNTNVYGDLKITSTFPTLYFTDLQQDDWRLMNDNGDFRFTNIDGTGHAIIINTNNNITLSGSLTGTTATFVGDGDIITAQRGTFTVKTSLTSVNNNILSTGKVFNFGTTDSQGLFFMTNNSVRMNITSGGNLLIGTTTDVGGNRKIQVAGGDFYTAEKSNTAGANAGYGGSSFQIRNGSTSEDLNFDLFNRTSFNWYTPFVIKNTGNVLIGTTTDDGVNKLQVDGAAKFTGNITTNNSSKIENGRISMEADGTLDWGDAKNYGTLSYDTNKAILRAHTGNALEFQTNGSGAALTLATNKNATFEGTMFLALSSTTQRVLTSTGTNSLQIGDTGINDIIFKNAVGSVATFLANGNVLIGTTTDDGSNKLQVAGNIKIKSTTAAQLFLDSASNVDAVLNFQENNVQKAKIGYDSSNSGLALVTGSGPFSTAAMVVLDTGNVLIGTTTDSGKKLQINSDTTYDGIQITGANIPTLGIIDTTNNVKLVVYTRDNDATIGTETNHVFTFQTNAVERARITSGGNVLIATTTDSGLYKLDVNGKQRVQSVLELEDVLTLNAISTPSDPASGKSSIYMDSADGAIKVKINVGGTVVTRTIASFE